MELLAVFIDIVLHLDKHLQVLIQNYGVWIYMILFLIIFCETGLVVTPFLPGDSLLFVSGALAATGSMHVHTLFMILVAASFLGDNTNYWIGRFFGPKVFSREGSLLLNPKHLERTQGFYDRHGGKTVVIARFVPIVRTFAPFVAGIGRMVYPRFLLFAFGGAILWIGSLVYAGYFFGNIPWVKNNLSLVIVGIVVLSILPGIVEFLRHKFSARATQV
ncbi:MAG TPA: DedA family protein [Burkholderiales bacterium]|nr:DedA family protein [Burkholderiales bacterium]